MGTLVRYWARARARMKQDPRRPFTVCVEGNIGCGKTTFLEHFSQFEKQVEVLTEPVDRWRNVNGHNLLQLMYEDPSRWAMPFQSYVQLTMLDNHLHQSAKPVKLMERSIFSARYCFVENMHKSGRILGCEYAVLDEWFKFVTSPESSVSLNVDLIIYRKTSPRTGSCRGSILCRLQLSSSTLTRILMKCKMCIRSMRVKCLVRKILKTRSKVPSLLQHPRALL